MPVRTQIIPETYHYVAILAQKELFPPEPKRDNSKKKGIKGIPKKD